MAEFFIGTFIVYFFIIIIGLLVIYLLYLKIIEHKKRIEWFEIEKSDFYKRSIIEQRKEKEKNG